MFQQFSVFIKPWISCVSSSVPPMSLLPPAKAYSGCLLPCGPCSGKLKPAFQKRIYPQPTQLCPSIRMPGVHRTAVPIPAVRISRKAVPFFFRFLANTDKGCFRQETAPGRQKNFWEVRRAVALRTVFRIQRHVRWIRKPCAARFPCAFPRPRRRRRREASALWALARSAKRPAGMSKYKGCARPARRTPIFASRGNVFWRIKPPQADFFDTLSLRLKAQTPCPPSKAGKYELTLEGLRALQTSRKGF